MPQGGRGGRDRLRHHHAGGEELAAGWRDQQQRSLHESMRDRRFRVRDRGAEEQRPPVAFGERHHADLSVTNDGAEVRG